MCRRPLLAALLLVVSLPVVAGGADAGQFDRPVALVADQSTAGGGAAVPAEPSTQGGGTVPAAPSTSGGGVDATRGAAQPPPNLTRADPSVVVTIDVAESGNARWTVASRFRIENETEVAALEAMAADARNRTGPVAGLGYSVETFRRFAVDAGQATAREDPMRIEDPAWSVRVDGENDTGVLALGFTWTNFADRRDNGSRVVLGDVFASTDGGTWFPALGPDQRLVLNAPPDYLVRENSLPYPIDERSIRIDGPANLSALDVSVVYERTDPRDGTTPPTEDGGIPQALLGGGVLVLGIGAVLVGYLLYRRPEGGVEPTGPDDGAAPGAAPAGGASGDGGAVESGETADAGDPADGGGATGTDAGPAPGADLAPGASGDAGAEADGSGAAAAAGDDGMDPELLSDEERVERLLEENGGRMKQSNIVSETGWSNAKVSQLLSGMDEDDRIDKLRIGRENLITLPEEDVGEID